MSRTESIKIAGHEFTAHPLNLGEAEEIADSIDGFTAGSTRSKIAAARHILLVAWRRTKPDQTEDAIRALETTPADLMSAVITILRVSGYVKEATAGKAPAAPGKRQAA